MRQLRAPVQQPDPIIISEYHKYCDKLFEEEIEPLIRNFSYDVEAWMNHLKTYNKQQEVIHYYNNYKLGKMTDHYYNDPSQHAYTLFCKKEKQLVGTKKPKCRAISAAPPLVKFIMGPVVQRLEQILNGRIHGYKLSFKNKPCKTWNDMEEMYNEQFNKGFDSIIDIDGSAWDSTQHYDMKYLTNKIYLYLYDNNLIKHIDAELFKEVSTQRYRRLVAKNYNSEGKVEIIFSAIIDSTTFSGSPDTTFMNTMTNLSFNRYILHKYGLHHNCYSMGCCGDDFNLLLSSEDNTVLLREFINTHWLRAGLNPKYVKNGDYSNITFCSTNIIQYKDGQQTKFKIVRQMDRMIPLSLISEKALHYSNGRLKYHYQELILGLKSWAGKMPFYSYFISAYEKQMNKIPNNFEYDKPGKPKVYFPTNEVYDDECYTNMDKVRVSSNQPNDEAVYKFLLDKFDINKSHIQQIYNCLHETQIYSPYEGEESITNDPLDQTE